MASVDVVIATYGDYDLWKILARRAEVSAENQQVRPDTIVHAHNYETDDLCVARNMGAADGDSEWIIFLDADDELDTGYVEAMCSGSGDLRWPSTLGVVDGREDDYPVLLQPQRSLLVGNHMVIGTMVRRSLFNDVGGFRVGLPILEDWDLWIRCIIAGGVAKPCAEAIYRVHVRSDSRNTDHPTHGWVYTEIQQRYRDHVGALVWRE